MKNLDLSNLIGFKLTHLGVLMILGAYSLANIISYTIEVITVETVPFSTTISIAVIFYIIEVLTLKLINKMLRKKKLQRKFNQLSDEEKVFVYKCYDEKQYFQTGYDPSFSRLREFIETYASILKVVTPQYISTESTYRILPASDLAVKLIAKEYIKYKQG